MAIPAVCDAVRGGEIGGDAAALSVAKPDGEKTVVADRVALALELCGAKMGVVLVSRLDTGTGTLVDNVESQATVKFITERAVVELVQWGAPEMYRAVIPVLSEVPMSFVDLAVLLKSAVLCTANIDDIEVLSEVFDVKFVSRCDAPEDVIAVCKGLWLLIGDGTEDTVTSLGTMKVPLLDGAGKAVPYDTGLTGVEKRDGDVVGLSCVERVDDRAAVKEVWYQVSLKPYRVDVLRLADDADSNMLVDLMLFITAEVEERDNASTTEVTIINGVVKASRETSTWVESWGPEEEVKLCRLMGGAGDGMVELAKLLRTATAGVDIHFVPDRPKGMVSFFWDCGCRTDEGDARASTTWFCAIRLWTKHRYQRYVWVKFMCGHTFVVRNRTADDQSSCEACEPKNGGPHRIVARRERAKVCSLATHSSTKEI
jgi:hypothetical protein